MPNPAQGLFDFYYVYGNLLRRQQAALAGEVSFTADAAAGGDLPDAAETYLNFLDNFRYAPLPIPVIPHGGDD